MGGSKSCTGWGGAGGGRRGSAGAGGLAARAKWTTPSASSARRPSRRRARRRRVGRTRAQRRHDPTGSTASSMPCCSRSPTGCRHSFRRPGQGPPHTRTGRPAGRSGAPPPPLSPLCAAVLGCTHNHRRLPPPLCRDWKPFRSSARSDKMTLKHWWKKHESPDGARPVPACAGRGSVLRDAAGAQITRSPDSTSGRGC